MKFKNRIKRALAGFLRDELLEFIGYDRNLYPSHSGPPFMIQTIEFDTIISEKVININRGHMGFDDNYEKDLEHCKRELLHQAEKCIHVETYELTSPEFSHARSIRLILRIQKPKQ